MEKEVHVSVSLKNHKADTIRYAAYAVSGVAYVLLEPKNKGAIKVTLEAKPGLVVSGADLKQRFEAELNDEDLRSAIADSNRDLRDFILLKALSAPEAAPRDGGDGLTPAQEKELDALIAQVEREIKAETNGKKSKDPLGITATWEEKHGSKRRGRKNKK